MFAFAGAYFWTTVPLLVVGVSVLGSFRPQRGAGGLMDRMIVAALALIALQLVPLPAALRLSLSPASFAFDRQVLLVPPDDPRTGPARALSIDPASTACALAVLIATAAIYWYARSTLSRGGLRSTCRGIAWLGLVLAAGALVQRALSPALIYGFWRPITPDVTPWGPFVNRNDFSMWLIMTIALAIGYGLARVDARTRPSVRAGEPSLDERSLWLASSISLMLAALFASLSRGGLVGLTVALSLLVCVSRGRLASPVRGWMTAVTLCMVAIALTFTSVPALAERISDTFPSGFGGRLTIWRETWPMVRHFWLTGIGVGAYRRGMTVYQQSTRLLFFNHAHNEYLQILVEGGIVLAGIAAVAIVAGGWQIAGRLRADRTPVFWIRLGAASGLAGAAVQSIWDTGLRLPANGILFAILAGIATHSAPQPRSGRRTTPASGRDPAPITSRTGDNPAPGVPAFRNPLNPASRVA